MNKTIGTKVYAIPFYFGGRVGYLEFKTKDLSEAKVLATCFFGKPGEDYIVVKNFLK